MTTQPSMNDCRDVTILLVDDQPTVRSGLRMLFQLERGAIVVGEAGNAVEAMALAAQMLPDLVIMDVEMPGMDGVTATARLLAASPHSKVVVLTIHNHAELRNRAMAAGACAFISKGNPEEVSYAFKQIAGLLASAASGGKSPGDVAPPMT